ncbi:hypothetical protein [Pilimelia columellifera]|uniref:Uncharacterized protein n=1 Tax=Pilimelia columellifera subsp. columellifera TaxID=706583 RepID=A0ABN3NJ68_9ACTN
MNPAPQHQPEGDLRGHTAPLRDWAAIGALAANAALLLAALLSLAPRDGVPYSVDGIRRFDWFVNGMTILLPALAVFLVSHLGERSSRARLVSVVALAQLVASVFFGIVFGALLGLYGLVTVRGGGAVLGLQTLLDWLGHLIVLGLAVTFVARVSQGLGGFTARPERAAPRPGPHPASRLAHQQSWPAPTSPAAPERPTWNQPDPTVALPENAARTQVIPPRPDAGPTQVIPPSGQVAETQVIPPGGQVAETQVIPPRGPDATQKLPRYRD